MTSAELRRIIEAMTERPWSATNYSSRPDSFYDIWRGTIVDRPSQRIARMMRLGDEAHSDAVAIATIVNHADALVALVEACEVAGRHLDLPPAVQDALDAVHAAGR